MDTALKTPETHPDHSVVGQYFRGYPGMYFCDSYDPRQGYWMTNVLDSSDRRNVSEAAIGRTFHEQRGLVRAHHSLAPDHTYYMVDLRKPNEAPVALTQVAADLRAEPGVLVFIEDFNAIKFLRNQRECAEQARVKTVAAVSVTA